ncbi:MAG: tautomerase family protein [Dokdonella sp.]
MSLVRISLIKGRAPDFGRRVGAIVYRSMLDTIALPAQDNFQIINEIAEGDLVYDPSYLDIARSDGIIVIEVTLNEGRSVERKRDLFAAIVEHLHDELGVRKEDVLINLVEVRKENWSFGNGIAQYAR